MYLNNVFIVISHIGETYAEDERSQARRGGYDPATYQWVGSYLPYLPIYDIYFPRKTLNELLCDFDAMQSIHILY